MAIVLKFSYEVNVGRLATEKLTFLSIFIWLKQFV